MTDDILPDGVNCNSSQQSSTPSPETTTATTNTYYVIPVASAAVTCSVLLVVIIVVLVLVAKRMCKSPAYAAHDEQLLPSATEDLQTTVSMHSFIIK